MTGATALGLLAVGFIVGAAVETVVVWLWLRGRWSALVLVVLVCVGILSVGNAHAYGEVPSIVTRTYSANCGNGVVTAGSAGAVASACVQARKAVSSVYTNCEATQTDTWTFDVVSQSSDGFVMHATKTFSWTNRAGSTCTQPQPVTYDQGNVSGLIGPPSTQCPPDSTGSGSKCYCNGSMKSDGSTCVAIGDCAAQAQAAEDFVHSTGKMMGIGGAATSTRFCNGGCTIQAAVSAKNAAGDVFVGGPFSATGGYCKGGEASGDSWTQPPIACAANQCPGTVNGQNVCVACSASQSSGAASATGAAASGSSSAVDGVPGATSKDSSVTCDGTNCTSTTTYRDASGNVVGTKSETKDQGSFCEQNPGLQICKNSTIAASCGAFSCNGDAVQCSIAQRLWEDSCEWAKGSEMQAKGAAAVAGGTRPGDHPANSGEVIGMSDAISTVDLLGGAGCPTDQTITVATATVVIPWSKACEPLQLLGNLAVAVSMLGAMFIVFRS